MSEGYPVRHSIAIETSGDPDKDQAVIDEYIISEKRQTEGICPNGCAVMVLDDPYSRHCPVCKFEGYSSIPFIDAVRAVATWEMISS